MRNSLHHFAAIAIAVGWTLGVNVHLSGQQTGTRTAETSAVSDSPGQPSQGEVTDPVADPRAVVVMGKARFTVLTPELIRTEWAADGKF